MEPLAAVGLASNVVQFIDFSCRLFSQTRKIHHSGSGSVAQTDDIALVSENLILLSSKLSSAAATLGGSSSYPSDLERSLQYLTARCKDDAADILAGLDEFKSRNPQSKWRSFRAALSVVWGEAKLNEMKDRPEGYRRQMITFLHIMQHEQQSSIFVTLSCLHKDNVVLQSSLTKEIEDLRRSVVHALQQFRDEFVRQDPKALPQAAQEGTMSIPQPGNLPADVNAVAGTLSDSARAASRLNIALKILRSLRFSSIGIRYSKIADAHTNTFEWMFSQSFTTWLRSEDPIFWISGKPGSGKSTLMKFLHGNPNTNRHLEVWAGGHEVVVASYFFWINGTEMQKSQQGLFQSLLYDILRRCPELIQQTFPIQWDEVQSNTFDSHGGWSRRELLDAYSRLIECQNMSTRFCLFIDGLDEYDGDHEDLIAVVKSLVRTKDMKLCQG